MDAETDATKRLRGTVEENARNAAEVNTRNEARIARVVMWATVCLVAVRAVAVIWLGQRLLAAVIADPVAATRFWSWTTAEAFLFVVMWSTKIKYTLPSAGHANE